MNLVFGMDGVICTPCKTPEEVERASPLTNVKDFMNWLMMKEHHITIWCKRPNSLDWVMATKEWCADHQIPYDRLLFDRPYNALLVTETPPNAKYYRHVSNDMSIISDMFEEWTQWLTQRE
jgi:hypothetical protein|tara:strand:+ start:132 stop:494 length:363 start_codon:yes stop_codon:yes gene_type:complete